jgi:hypothetical protein
MNKQNNNACLVFIYNADSGAINAIRDYFHKMIKPSTYECNLCAVTFGNLRMKREWAQFVKELKEEIEVEFLHKDEFEEYYPQVQEAKYPSAYYIKGEKYHLFITKEEMNKVETIAELKKMTKKKLEKIK